MYHPLIDWHLTTPGPFFHQSPLVQRADDRLETVRERLRLYDHVTAPVIEFYRARGDGALLEFELTSGVADMWPRLADVVRRQWMSGGTESATPERK